MELEKIVLVRHGESESNAGGVTPQELGDFRIPLTDFGKQQAVTLGEAWGSQYFTDSLIYCSPYLRTRQTLQHICQGMGVAPASVPIKEDPRLREIELGYADYWAELKRRKEFGWFYYRAKEGGENVADVYDRCSMFMESMWREVARKQAKKVVIVCHGMVIRAFLMRFFQLSVEEFDQMVNPNNCDQLTIARRGQVQTPLYTTSHWAMAGDLTLRERKADAWDWSQID